MNAGWGGDEIAGVIRRVWIYRLGYGVEELDHDGRRFGYRASRFQEEGEVILKVDLQLHPGCPSPGSERGSGAESDD